MKGIVKRPGVPPLPEGFLESLAPLLLEEAQGFLQSYEKPYVRGLRLNPLKAPENPFVQYVSGVLQPVPWEKQGYYLEQESLAGAHPLHDAGAYYIQEPSAMAAVSVLDPKPGETILDLCAAPGGKSTQIAGRLGGKGLLVSNEPVYSRAQILSGNLERMGVTNALVTSELPERLAGRWPGMFDRILVDAPCSGEGMFRRHPETREAWTCQSPGGCASRQRDILRSAARMLKAGGFLCYSTCTFNSVENEGVVEGFLEEHADFAPVPFSLFTPEENRALQGYMHLFPHKVLGEGHFVALFQKKEEAQKERALEYKPFLGVDKVSGKAYEAFCAALGEKSFEATGMFGGQLVCAQDLPDISGLKVLRAGVHLGRAKGDIFVPDHAFAMAMKPPYEVKTFPLSLKEAGAYLHGEALPAPDDLLGWVLPTFAGMALGWGKASGGFVKNHYPKGLRK